MHLWPDVVPSRLDIQVLSQRLPRLPVDAFERRGFGRVRDRGRPSHISGVVL